MDAGFVDHKAKRVVAVDMSCPWLDNRARKDTEKTEKYKPLRWELTRQYPGYKIVQLNVIMDVLGEWSKELDVEMNKIFGARSSDVLKRMQEAVLSSSLNIARTFKVITKRHPSP